MFFSRAVQVDRISCMEKTHPGTPDTTITTSGSDMRDLECCLDWSKIRGILISGFISIASIYAQHRVAVCQRIHHKDHQMMWRSPQPPLILLVFVSRLQLLVSPIFFGIFPFFPLLHRSSNPRHRVPTLALFPRSAARDGPFLILFPPSLSSISPAPAFRPERPPPP